MIKITLNNDIYTVSLLTSQYIILFCFTLKSTLDYFIQTNSYFILFYLSSINRIHHFSVIWIFWDSLQTFRPGLLLIAIFIWQVWWTFTTAFYFVFSGSRCLIILFDLNLLLINTIYFWLIASINFLPVEYFDIHFIIFHQDYFE